MSDKRSLSPEFIRVHTAVLIALTAYILLGGGDCLIRLISGFPCPGCGTVRAWQSLFFGDLSKAANYHPLFLFAPFAVLIPVHIGHIFKRFKTAAVTFSVAIAAAMYITVYVIRIIDGSISVVM